MILSISGIACCAISRKSSSIFSCHISSFSAAIFIFVFSFLLSFFGVDGFVSASVGDVSTSLFCTFFSTFCSQETAC
jgi:hypothetical protein